MRLSHVLALLAGGAIAALIAVAIRPEPRTERASKPTRAAPDPRIDTLLARLDRIESQLSSPRDDPDVDARLARIETLLASMPSDRSATADAPTLSDEELKLRADALSTDLTKAPEAIAAWEQFAKQTRDPKAKAEAWFAQGELYRKLNRWPDAERVWQKVVDTEGIESERGQTALYQLAWAQARQQETRAALKSFQTLAAAPNLSKAMDSATRLQIAGFARATGDIATARREYQRYIDDYANDDAEFFRERAKTAAEQLKKLR